MISLERCDGPTRHWSENTIDRSSVVTVALQLNLDVYNYPIRRQGIVPVDRAVVLVGVVRIIAPSRYQYPEFQSVRGTQIKRDPRIVAVPPIAIVVCSRVISERGVILTAELAASPVVVNSHITINASHLVGRHARWRIHGSDSSPVNVQVPLPIDRNIRCASELDCCWTRFARELLQHGCFVDLL